jgi:putative membrane-bound dehydrogenase-like protein
MKPSPLARNCIYLILVSMVIMACDSKPKKPIEIPLTIQEDSAVSFAKAKEIRERITAKIADGLELSLWATDSLAPDPIALQIDDAGTIYLTRTNRSKNSEFDIRGYRQWMTPSIALQSVEDRRAFLRATFAPELSEENAWLPDLNHDSIHDWHDLTVEKDEVWKLEDTNKDGMADVSKRILEDFNEEVTDVAGALLVRKEDVFVGVGPDMWRLWDTNGDGVLDEKTSIAHGFAVHIGFGGHGMSGAIEGPDGKIYWGIGDIGANLTTLDGTNHKYPNQGVIVRSNPDGSNFEVFARGLRNTHEFVFDAYGNIISSDNDGDHAGESERLVHIVEGSDAGWRSNWQYGKYTDPKNNGYNVWMDEKMYVPRWEGQAAYFIPPITNYHNGPTGMAFNPGTALGSDWIDKFFLVEFVGDPSRSHIWSFGLRPKGASFELDNEVDVLSGVLPTGIQFGPDGALYLADWVNGWGTKNYGRVWKLDVTPNKNDLEIERLKTRDLMLLDYGDQSNDELVALLGYPDMRIRKKAQFELATRTFWGYRALKKVLKEENNQFARIHAIWGIGQIAANDLDKAAPLLVLLADEDPEIVAQAIKVMGDVKYQKAAVSLVPMLQNENDRVKFYAAQALGRLAYEPAVGPLLKLLAANNDEDLYLRHAAVLALSRIGKSEPIVALANDPNRSLRLAAVLVLRRMQDKEVALFLQDHDEYIAAEAARAINDDWSIPEAMPALAAMLAAGNLTSEPLLRRAINAALRVGGDQELENLIAFSKRTNVPNNLRGEALATLANWASPSVLDRVDGRFRGEVHRDSGLIKSKMEHEIPIFLKEKDPDLLIGVSKTLAALGIDNHNKELLEIMRKNTVPSVRAAMLEALGVLEKEKINDALTLGMRDPSQEVRETAVGLLGKLEIPESQLPILVDAFFKTGSGGEQQRMLGVLGDMPLAKSEPILKKLIQKGKQNQLSPNVILDLIEAVEASKSVGLIAQLGQLKSGGHTVDAYQETLYGGRWWQGRSVFTNNPTAQCVRCHAVAGSGGKVGPPLDHIGSILTREQILESLIEPGARLAPGYGTVVLTLKDGQKVTGILEEETKDALLLRTSDAEPMEIAASRIQKRENMPSAMPAMGLMISKRELRDLIEYLSSLKKDQQAMN